MAIIRTVFEILGYASTLAVVVGVGVGVVSWIRGILPAILRLGKGLAKRRIAVFAKGDDLTSLIDLLVDSKLFNEKNIVRVASINDLGRAEDASVFLVFWHHWQDDISQILDEMSDGTALVVYAPQELGPIPPEPLKRIGEARNVTVTNFRGRLLSDLVVSMMTTSYG